jgi:hypothetical protein
MVGRVDVRTRLLDAVGVALEGDWRAAHQAAQEHEGDPVADWLHAVVHRMEGDLANAGYWYRCVWREMRKDVTEREELLRIRTALASRTS